MHHVVQENLFHEYGFNVLVDALQAYNLPYTIVKVIPFLHELAPDLNFLTDIKVMTWGGTTLGGIARMKGWQPGQFMNANFDMRRLHFEYGEHMLNRDARFCTFGDLAFEGEMFVRPVHDSKSFTGMVIASEKMTAWKDRVVAVSNDGFATLRPETEVTYASVKDIELEARFFVVDGQVITGSSYRSLGRQIMYQRVEYNNPLMRPMLDFAQRMVKRWSPDRAFVIDIAQVDGVYYVIEINCINHAGFYACDMCAVLKAVEHMDI